MTGSRGIREPAGGPDAPTRRPGAAAVPVAETGSAEKGLADPVGLPAGTCTARPEKRAGDRLPKPKPSNTVPAIRGGDLATRLGPHG